MAKTITTAQEALERLERQRAWRREYQRRYAQTETGRASIQRTRLRSALRKLGFSSEEAEKMISERLAASAGGDLGAGD